MFMFYDELIYAVVSVNISANRKYTIISANEKLIFLLQKSTINLYLC